MFFRHEILILDQLDLFGGISKFFWGIRFQREPARRLDKNAGGGVGE